MNDELQKQIADVLHRAVEAAQKGGEWIGGQIPDVLHQLLVWTIAKGFIGLIGIFFYVLALALLIPRHWSWVKSDEKYGSRDLTYIPIATIAGIALIPVSICFGMVLDALQAWIAPKLFLLEYAAHLIK